MPQVPESVQVLLFAQLASKIKLNAPYAFTWLEIVAVRWERLSCRHCCLARHDCKTKQ